MSDVNDGLDALAQREALLLRLNDEIDADAHAAISDTERYLRDPPPAPPPPSHTDNTASHYRRTQKNNAENGTALRNAPDQPPVRWPVKRSDIGAARGCGGGAGGGRKDAGVRGGAGESGWDVGASADESASHMLRRKSGRVIAASGPRERTKMDVATAPGSCSSPLFRLSDRVKEAARASSERNRRKAATSPGLAAGAGYSGHSQSRPVSRQGETHTESGRESAASTRPESRESQRRSGGDGHSSGEAGVDFGCVPAGIGEEATARFLKAKLCACQAQLETVRAAQQSSQLEATELRKQAASEHERARRLSRQLQQQQQANETAAKAKDNDAASSATLSSRVSELERELGCAKKIARQANTDKKSLEVRLHRALEEISRQKQAVRQARGQSKDLGQEQRLEVAKLATRNQRLERQKMELLSAFKKQLKLIDVLKRQKFHVEAARLLAFTEEDFVKTLDWAV